MCPSSIHASYDLTIPLAGMEEQQDSCSKSYAHDVKAPVKRAAPEKRLSLDKLIVSQFFDECDNEDREGPPPPGFSESHGPECYRNSPRDMAVLRKEERVRGVRPIIVFHFRKILLKTASI